jgi:hypothetical protein
MGNITVETTSKDDLILKIRELEASQESRKVQLADVKLEWTDLSAKAADLEAQLKAVKEAEYEARQKKIDKHHELQEISDAGKLDAARLEQAKRELARLLDGESINDRYQEQVDEFRNRCLEAYWRAENRTDGYGAYRYQIEGAIHLAVAQQAILGDKQGLGKSLTSLIYADFLGAQKIILVVPSDVMGNYIREINMWAPHRAPIQLGKMTPGQRNAVLRGNQAPAAIHASDELRDRSS